MPPCVCLLSPSLPVCRGVAGSRDRTVLCCVVSASLACEPTTCSFFYFYFILIYRFSKLINNHGRQSNVRLSLCIMYIELYFPPCRIDTERDPYSISPSCAFSARFFLVSTPRRLCVCEITLKHEQNPRRIDVCEEVIRFCIVFAPSRVARFDSKQ